jgi:hypothetical protein
LHLHFQGMESSDCSWIADGLLLLVVVVVLLLL